MPIKKYECAACHGKFLFLLDRELCTKCTANPPKKFKKAVVKKHNPRMGRPRESRIQLKVTQALKKRCMIAMTVSELSVNGLSIELGLPRTNFRRWIRGEYSVRGQRLFNPRVAEALDSYAKV